MEKQHTYVPAKISSLSLDADQKKSTRKNYIFPQACDTSDS